MDLTYDRDLVFSTWHRLRLHCRPLRTWPQPCRIPNTSPPCHMSRLPQYMLLSKLGGPPRQSTAHESLGANLWGHCFQSHTTLWWHSLKMLSRMISHFCTAQALQYGFESHGKFCVSVSAHFWLVFQLFPNSSAPIASDECLVMKSSLRSPLLFPQRPHTLPYRDQKGKLTSKLYQGNRYIKRWVQRGRLLISELHYIRI